MPMKVITRAITEATPISIGALALMLGGLSWVAGLSSQVQAQAMQFANQDKRQDQFREALIRKEEKLDLLIKDVAEMKGELHGLVENSKNRR